MKKFIKDNKYFILVLIFIYLIFNIKLPYYIEGPGDLININDRYEIENSYKSKGSINMTYVSEYKANVAGFIFAKVNGDYDLYKKEKIIPSNETEKEANYRGKIMLKEASDNAIIIAYKKAGKSYEIKNQKIVITYIEDDTNTNLKVGDEIISVDGIKVNNREELKNIITKHKVGEKINFKVKNKKESVKYGYLRENKTIGFLISYDRDLITEPSIKIKYEKDEYGPSGGLMTTLTIYNKLVEEDITHGKIIAGTGTIEEDETVGEIDGIKYKLKGAVKNKADVFLCPSGSNYKEAIKLKKKHNYKIKIVEVKTIDDAINYLKKEV